MDHTINLEETRKKFIDITNSNYLRKLDSLISSTSDNNSVLEYTKKKMKY